MEMSAGDVLMLSQVSWRLTCAFAASRANAPLQFQEVENELKSLTHSLTTFAGSLDQDGSLLERTDIKTKTGIASILGSCSQSLDNLDTLVNSYQDTHRVEQPGGAKDIQRSWRSYFLTNYQTIIWTTEGGNIQSLKKMLTIHTLSVMIAIDALQTRSLSRLENAIVVVADKVGDIHNRLNSDLDIKLENIYRALMSTKNNLNSASMAGSPIPWPQRQSSLSGNSPVSPGRGSYGSYGSQPPIPPRSDRRLPSYGSIQDPLSPQRTPDLSGSDFNNSPVKPFRGSQSSSVRNDRFSEMSTFPNQFYQLPESQLEYDSNRRKIGSISHDLERLELGSKGTTSPIREAWEGPGLPGVSAGLSPHLSISARSPAGSSRDDPFAGSAGILPPPSMPIPSPQAPPSDDPFDKIRMLRKAGDGQSEPGDISPMAQQRVAWEKLLFTNSAVLCDTRGASVEYTQPDESKPGDFVMEKACDKCRVCLVTKPFKLVTGNIRYSTSIWTLSEDGEVRLEQKIPDDGKIIPYTVWDNQTKIVLRLKTELRYHDCTPDNRPTKRAETAWVNYIFDEEHAATMFQNAIMSQTLLLSVRTRRTMRLFQGVSGAFAFAEQLCGLENLRIFYDPNTNVASGLIQYIPDFSDGYMTIPLNDVRNPIRIREENNTTVRIKGLKIPFKEKVARRPSMTDSRTKPKQEKFLTGAKIEFYAKSDKDSFMAKLKDIQDSFLGSV